MSFNQCNCNDCTHICVRVIKQASTHLLLGEAWQLQKYAHYRLSVVVGPASTRCHIKTKSEMRPLMHSMPSGREVPVMDDRAFKR